MPPSTSTGQYHIKPFFTDYRELDSDAREVANISQFKGWILGLNLDKRVTELLLEAIDIAERYRNLAWNVLTSPPLTPDSRVDLRILEGAGFYQKVDEDWLYHKGGGSIEALALSERYLPKEKSFVAFGAAYPGVMGLHGDSAFLGTKRLKVSMSEFAGALAYMITFTKNCFEQGFKVENVIKYCCVPVSIISMPSISKLCNERDDDYSKSARARYVKPHHQVSKIVLLVPSSIRGTDKHEVDGKWHETRTIFSRTCATYNCVFNSINLDTYWSEPSQFAFGTAVRSLITSGMIQDVASAHMQNLYFVPNVTDFTSVPADFDSMFYRYHFTETEWELMLLNNLVGWKNAESFAPCCYPIDKYRHSAVRAFFQGLLQEEYNPIISNLYFILPIPLTSAIIKLLLQKTTPAQYSGRLFEEIFSFFPKHLQMTFLFKKGLEDYKKKLSVLYGTVSSIRAKHLNKVLLNGLEGNISEAYELLCTIADLARHTTDFESENLLMARLLSIYLELLFDEPEHVRNKKLRTLIEQIKIFSNMDLVNIYIELSVNLFVKKIINFKNFDDRIKFISQRIEESIYSNHRRLRKKILDLLHSEEKETIIRWIDSIKDLMCPWIENPDGFIESYLSYMFKKDGILESLHNDPCSTIISYLLGAWDGISAPYVRRYPHFNLIKLSLMSSNDELGIDQQKLKALGNFWITFYLWQK